MARIIHQRLPRRVVQILPVLLQTRQRARNRNERRAQIVRNRIEERGL